MWGRRISKSFNLYERVLIGLIDFSNWSLTNARQDKGQLVFSILVWTLSTVETPSCHIDTKVQLKRVFCFLCLVVVLFQVAIQRERENKVSSGFLLFFGCCCCCSCVCEESCSLRWTPWSVCLNWTPMKRRRRRETKKKKNCAYMVPHKTQKCCSRENKTPFQYLLKSFVSLEKEKTRPLRLLLLF